MATQTFSQTNHRDYYTDDDFDDSQSDQSDHHNPNHDEEDDEEEESIRGNKNFLHMCGGNNRGQFYRGWSLGQVLDPRARWVQEWNRVFLLVCATGLFVDPLFFYALSVSDTCMCLFIDGWFAITVTALRCMSDALHVWNMWLQIKMAKRPYGSNSSSGGSYGSNDNNGVDSGPRGFRARSAALTYLKSKKGFFFDLFVILPLPQVRFLNFLIGLAW